MIYLALLRGINVGGNNIIKMADLKKVFEDHGYTDVVTYIQSGNVIFSSSEANEQTLAQDIETMLAEAFHYHGKIVLVSHTQLQTVLDRIPQSWHSEDLRCYLAFVRAPFTPGEIAKEIKLNSETDMLETGSGVLYMSTKADGLTSSGFSKGISAKISQEITIRNLATIQKLLELATK